MDLLLLKAFISSNKFPYTLFTNNTLKENITLTLPYNTCFKLNNI